LYPVGPEALTGAFGDRDGGVGELGNDGWD